MRNPILYVPTLLAKQQAIRAIYVAGWSWAGDIDIESGLRACASYDNYDYLAGFSDDHFYFSSFPPRLHTRQ